MSLTGAQSFDWCSFYSLFWNDKGLKCKVNIPATVLFRYGQLSAWWATNKDGCIQRHSSQSSTMENIRKHFLDVSGEDVANYSKFVAISRHGDGRPQLIRLQAFNQLSELLSDRLESGHPDEAPSIETPSVLQTFVQPYQDLRYVTTLINNGVNLTCHTFQRKFSRRYTPMSATTSASHDNTHSDVILGFDSDANARRMDVDQQMGAVEPALKMKLRKLVAHIVKYVQQAHSLTIGGIVCEFIRDTSDKIYLLSVLRVEWASNAGGHGSGSLASTIMQSDPIEMADVLVRGSFDDVTHDPGSSSAMDPMGEQGRAAVAASATYLEHAGEDGEVVTSPLQTIPSPSQGAPRLMSPIRPGPRSPSRGDVRPSTAATPGAQPGGMQRTSALIDYPGAQRTASVNMNVHNSWPSAQHHTWQQIIGGPANMSVGLPPDEARGTPQEGGPSQRPYSAAVVGVNKRLDPSSPMAERRTAINATNREKKQAPAGGTAGFGGGAPSRPQTASSTLRRTGAHVNEGVRGAPVIMHQLQKENETLRDQLLYQHAMAEASAEKIRQLEHDRDMSTGAFGDRSNELQQLLASQKEMIRTLSNEREHWKMRAESAEANHDHSSAEASEMERKLADERGTMIKALKDHQDKEVQDRVHIEQLESELMRVSEQLRIETTSINALKRQLLEFSDIADRHKATLRDGTAEPGLEETIGLVKHLFNDQINPTGEMYAVQKVMVHYHADLRSIFLYYAQLESNFTDHWPPVMTFAQWMLFCRDSETSDLRAAAALRNNANYLLLSPTDCQNVFGKYAVQDMAAAEGATLAGSARASIHSATLTYEVFLAAVIHLSARIKRTNVAFLSEALREYVLRYLSKAGRVSPAGLKRGQVRSALQGTTKIGETMAAMGTFHHDRESGPPSPVPSQVHGGAPAKVRAGSAKRAARQQHVGGPWVSTPPTSRPQSAAMYRSQPMVVSRPQSALSRGSQSRPSSAKSGATDLAKMMVSELEMTREEAGNSAIVLELELMDVSTQARMPKEVIRRGGGFNL